MLVSLLWGHDPHQVVEYVGGMYVTRSFDLARAFTRFGSYSALLVDIAIPLAQSKAVLPTEASPSNPKAELQSISLTPSPLYHVRYSHKYIHPLHSLIKLLLLTIQIQQSELHIWALLDVVEFGRRTMKNNKINFALICSLGECFDGWSADVTVDACYAYCVGHCFDGRLVKKWKVGCSEYRNSNRL